MIFSNAIQSSVRQAMATHGQNFVVNTVEEIIENPWYNEIVTFENPKDANDIMSHRRCQEQQKLS